jgi:hypothetical protein
MITINFFFWTFVVMFGAIGAIRGWAKELLVSFSIILALFVMQVALTHIGIVKRVWDTWGGQTQFYFASIVVIMFALFGYHTPNNRHAKRKVPREWLQDMMLGGVLGAGNGYLLVGTVWYFLHEANYPFPDYIITPPIAGTPAGDFALKIIEFLPPVWLLGPVLYIVAAVSFTFVVIALI